MKTLHMNTWAVEYLLGHVDGVSFEEGIAKLAHIVTQGADDLMEEILLIEEETASQLFGKHFEGIFNELDVLGMKGALTGISLSSIPHYAVRYIFEVKARQMLEGHHGWCDHEVKQEEVNGSDECFSYCVKCGQEV
ncbi:hypothetical protein 035JT004_273 [Bacillus phage 035JT004]|nr:hypothetical protein 035JT004_3 [Bacillus phage 035JT004]QZA69761.1 hypothetical protein 035JT004_273 [Bacillus phage 035JT004]